MARAVFIRTGKRIKKFRNASFLIGFHKNEKVNAEFLFSKNKTLDK
jgi:hypothetical protein